MEGWDASVLCEVRTMTGRIAMPYEARPYVADKKRQAKNLNDRILKKHLCEAGPAMCSKCRLCSFGVEYLNRGLPVEEGKRHE